MICRIRHPSGADIERFKETLGRERAELIVQYGNFLWNLAQGDFGTS